MVILTDNDTSFWKKIEVIRNAKEELRLGYCIYHNDFTSSYLSRELIRAAQRGVKIKLLVDYFRSYPMLDLFSAMEKASKGNLQVKFYGRPTRNVVLDAAYLTIGCDGLLLSNKDREICQEVKKQKLDQLVAEAREPQLDIQLNISNMNIAKSGLFLSGLYAKDAEVMAMAAVEGQGIDLSALKQDAMSDEEGITDDQKDGLKKFLKLIWNSKTESNPMNRFVDGMELKFAFMAFGESMGLNRIYNGITGIVPFSTNKSEAYENSLSEPFIQVDREHITDYIHHKIVLADGNEWVMGGRNIHDGYHMSSEDLVSNYLFIDTDVSVKAKSDSQDMKDAYDQLFDFRALAASLSEVKQHAPNDTVAGLALMREQCLDNFLAQYDKIEGVDLSTAEAREEYQRMPRYRVDERKPEFKEDFKAYKGEACTELKLDYSQSDREKIAMDRLLKKAAEYENYAQQKGLVAKTKSQFGFISMGKADQSTVEAYYLQNMHFEKSEIESDQTRRIYGLNKFKRPDSKQNPEDRTIVERVIDITRNIVTTVLPFLKGDVERVSSKYIHDAWIRGLENVCATSKDGNKKQKVILHNAYFAPPGNLLTAFANMIDGTWDCHNVDLIIITNSLSTTDLSPVNLAGRHAMMPVLEYDREINGVKRRPRAGTIAYYEYKNQERFFKRSLHSKVTVLGDKDIIVGSANADYRSYLMDTNNALYIKNAPEMVAQHSAELMQLVENLKANRQPEGEEFEPVIEVLDV
ncbi:MAG: phospholipase D-like domain-containing protein [Bdellovibrionales bacterium]